MFTLHYHIRYARFLLLLWVTLMGTAVTTLTLAALATPIPHPLHPTDQLPVGAPVYKIEINADGLYDLTYNQLAAAGMDVDAVNPHTFALMHRGQPVAYQFIGDADNQFEAGEAVRFYGWAFADSRYEKQFVTNNVFWLWADSTPAYVTEGAPPTNPTPVSHYQASVTTEPENLFYHTRTNQWSFFPNEADAWYWARLAALQSSFVITLPHPSSLSGTAAFTVEMLGAASTTPRTITATFNNQPGPGVHSWWAVENFNIMGNAPLTAVNNGPNEVRLTLDTVGGARVYLNRITVTYPRLLVADDEQLLLTHELAGAYEFAISGYTHDAPLVWDVSNPYQPQQILATIAGVSSYTITFASEHAAGASFVATTEAGVKTAAAITPYTPPNLDPANGAAWVVISYADFITAVQPLAAHRQQPAFGGFSTHLVNVADIINQYGYGLPLPEAIRAYLRHALTDWQTPPQHVLLVGDGTVNPRQLPCAVGCQATWDADEMTYIPTDLLFADPYQGLIPSDYSYALLTGDDLQPDVTIGRLPVQTITETTAVVNKIVQYDLAQVFGAAAQEQLLFVADNPNTAGDFCQSATEVGAAVPAPFGVNQLCLPDGDPANLSWLRTTMSQTINVTGTAVLHYFGRGSITAWGNGILAADDPDFWDNADNLVTIFSASALDGYFAYPGAPGLGETLLRLPAAGAAAYWGTSGVTTLFDLTALHNGLYTVTVPPAALGTAVNTAKLNYLQMGMYDTALLYSFNLLGDPALAFLRTKPTAAVTLAPPAAASMAPGATAVYTFTLSNNGQAADVYTLTLTSTWPATLPITRTARLFPQEQTAIPITLTAPLTATSSTPNLLQLTAYSTFDTAVSATATLQTEIHWPVFLPIMSHN